jgi:hypothetical protein
MKDRRKTGYNRRLAQWRVTWLIEHSTSHQLLWCIDSFVLRNPPLRQAPKRYRLYMRTIFVLTILISQSLFGQVNLASNEAQSDVLLFKDKYVIFNMDTFNRIDEHGFINGKGIAILCDPTQSKINKRVTTNSCSLPDETTMFNCKSDAQKINDTTMKKVDCNAVGTGLYKKNKKEGVWKYSSEKNLRKTDAEVTYLEGKIQSIACFSKTNENEVYLKAELERPLFNCSMDGSYKTNHNQRTFKRIIG